MIMRMIKMYANILAHPKDGVFTPATVILYNCMCSSINRLIILERFHV